MTFSLEGYLDVAALNALQDKPVKSVDTIRGHYTPGPTWARPCSLPAFAVISHRSKRAQRVSTPLDLPKIDNEIVITIPKIILPPDAR